MTVIVGILCSDGVVIGSDNGWGLGGLLALAMELELRRVKLPGKDKENRARYVGTILWRNPDKFENIEGKGYWLKGVPIPETENEKKELRRRVL